jgi:hypothetical protein
MEGTSHLGAEWREDGWVRRRHDHGVAPATMAATSATDATQIPNPDFEQWEVADQPLRENCNTPSAWNFPESQKSGTRGRQSSPSVALGEELHSGKTTHEKEKVHLTAALDGAV